MKAKWTKDKDAGAWRYDDDACSIMIQKCVRLPFGDAVYIWSKWITGRVLEGHDYSLREAKESALEAPSGN